MADVTSTYGDARGSARLVFDPHAQKKKCVATSTDPEKYECATLRMGAASGLVAVDIDKPSSRRAAPSEFVERFAESLEATLQQTTASGNKHHIYKLPDNPLCANTKYGIDGTALDYIASGAFIFAEPCYVGLGKYAWDGGFDRRRALDMPQEMQDYLCRPRAATKQQEQDAAAYYGVTSDVYQTMSS